MQNDFSMELNLATLQGGKLNDDFIAHYQDVLSALNKGESGKITINVILKRPKDMETMVMVETTINSQKPKRARSEYGTIQVENDTPRIKVSKPKPKVQPVALFDVKEN